MGDDGEERTVDEGQLDALALEAAAYIRSRGGALEPAIVVAELCRTGASAQDAWDAIDHGLRSGALVVLGATKIDAGIVRGWL